MINNRAPFPQANDFEKVLKVINVPSENLLSDYFAMKSILSDVSERQVDYYISACVYLGLIEDKIFTNLGRKVREMTGIEQCAEIARIIVSNEVFGTVYFQTKMLGIQLEKEDVIEIMKEYVEFNVEPMYLRRASTVMSWVKWIISMEQ